MTTKTSNTAPAPADFNGYLALLLPAGEAPGVYRIERVSREQAQRDGWACEDCGKQDIDTVLPMYRWVELAEVSYALHLGCCHTCLVERYWLKRHADDEAPSGHGDRMHIYPAVDPVTRARQARR